MFRTAHADGPRFPPAATGSGGLRGLVWLVMLAAGGLAGACNVPVFRYALERWDSGNYVAVVAHDEALSAAQQAVVGMLADLSWENDGAANLSLQVIDVAATPDDPAVGHLPLGRVSLPAVFLFYPAGFGEPTLIWSGGLSEQSVGVISRSPLRDRFVALAVKGTTATWVLIESGRAEADDRAEQVLRESLTAMEQELELPRGVIPRSGEVTGPEHPAGVDNGYFDSVNRLESEVPLLVAFEVVRLAPADPREEVLVAMLMNVVPGLAERRGEPLAFPLFGRGRILEPLVGDGIRVDNIAAASRYLCGPCSCQLKALNPGVDMLMDVDWEARLAGAAGMGGRGSAAPGGAAAAGGGMVADPSPVPAAGQSPPAASGTGGNRLPRHLTWVSGAVVLLLAAAAMAIIRKSR